MIREKELFGLLTRERRINAGKGHLLVYIATSLGKPGSATIIDSLRYLLYELHTKGRVVVTMNGNDFTSVELPAATEEDEGSQQLKEVYEQVIQLQSSLQIAQEKLRRAQLAADHAQAARLAAVDEARRQSSRARDLRRIRALQARVSELEMRLADRESLVSKLEQAQQELQEVTDRMKGFEDLPLFGMGCGCKLARMVTGPDCRPDGPIDLPAIVIIPQK